MITTSFIISIHTILNYNYFKTANQFPTCNEQNFVLTT